MSERRTVSETLLGLAGAYDDEIEIKASDLMDDLRRAIDDAPPPCRDSVVVRIAAAGDYASLSAYVCYTRPETDEEMAERLEIQAADEARQRLEDRKTYDRLKRKFEGPAS